MDARDLKVASRASKERKEGKLLQHPWQPTRLNGWNSVCLLLHRLCSIKCTKLENLANHQSAALQTSPHRQSKQGRALCMSATTVIKRKKEH